MRTRVFLDFWNFNLNWNNRTGKAPLDWPKLPRVLVASAQQTLSGAGLAGDLAFDEIRVYASYNCDSPNDRNLKRWLDSFLGKQPGFAVHLRERHSRHKPVFCQACRKDISNCPFCNQPLCRATEKGVDTALCTDLLSLAWENVYDLAILVTSDADLVPAVQRLQNKNVKVVNGTWSGHGHELAKACWAHFQLDGLTAELKR